MILPATADKKQAVQNSFRLDALDRSQTVLHFAGKFNFFIFQHWTECRFHAKVYIIEPFF